MTEREPLWFDRKNHAYWVDGVRLPGVTRVIAHAGVATDYSMIDTGTMDGARNRGNIVHEIIHKHHTEGTTLRSQTNRQADACLRAYEKFLAETCYQPVRTEIQLYSTVFWYAGTIDSGGFLFGDRTLVDVKSSHDVNKDAVDLQTAAYAWLWDETYPEEKIERRVCLHLMKTGRYRLVPCEDPMAFDKFVEALQSMRDEED
jgi:hypothetical protein